MGSSGSFGFACVNLGEPLGRRVHSGSRGFAWSNLGVFGFVQVRVRSFGQTSWSSCSIAFVWIHSVAPRGPRVLPDSRGFTRAHHVVVEFI